MQGANRAAACEARGVKIRSVDYTGKDPLAFVVSKNLKRRHLTASQRAMIAEKVANMPKGRPKKNVENSTISDGEAAKQLNVSRDSIQQARKVRTTGTPELATAVEQGKLPVSVAALKIFWKNLKIKQ